MSIKKILIFLAFFSFVGLFFPKSSRAIDLREALKSENSIIVKIKEGVEYFFAFKVENKVAALEKHAERRLVTAQDYAEEGNNERVQNLLQNYLQIKERQNNLLGRTSGEGVLEKVAERTIEQQKTMEEIKSKINEDGKQNIIQAQEKVVNQVAKQVVEANGPEGATEFLNQAAHVWAPGTGPGGEAGVVYAGGGKLIYAPGTGPGGQGGVVIEGGEMKFATGASMDAPGADVKTHEVKTGGVSNDVAPVNDSGPNWAPGTTQGGTGGDTINAGDGGGLAPGTTLEGKNELAP